MKKYSRYSILLLLSLCFYLSAPITNASTDKLVEEPYRVLFISSYSYSWDSIPFQVEGLKGSFPIDDYTLNYEFMDTKNTDYSNDFEEFYHYLKFKLQTRLPYDGIIIGDDAALQFAMMYRDELFPNTPIVFEGIDNIQMAIAFAEDPLITGIVERVDYAENIALVGSLFPKANRLVLIYDDLENGIGIANQLTEMSELFKDYEVEYLNTSNHTKEELAEQLSSFGQNDIVFGITIGEQKGGQIYTEDERYRLIQEYAAAPIFSITSAGVGSGMLGGYIIDHEASGFQAGEMMREILEKGHFPSIQLDTPSTYYFDYEQLKTYNIATYKIPKEAIIINKPESFVRKYAFILIPLLATGLTVVVIAYYLRRRANEKLKKTYNQLVVTEADLQKQYEENQEHIAELIHQEAKNLYQAEHDYLTNLPNRRTTMKRLDTNLKEHIDFTVLLIDIDNFKEINDVYSHSYGDKILQTIADRLTILVDEKGFVSRFGGDEFLIIIEETESQHIQTLLNHIQNSFKEPIQYEKMNFFLKASIGIADSKLDVTKSTDIVSNVDMALYEAKVTGKNTFIFYESSMRQKVAHIQSIQDILRQACENEDFELFYQPQIDVKTGKTCSYEALIRLKNHPISPGEFIPIAESTDLILKIGRIVTETVIHQLVEWRENGLDLHPVAINFSTKQIRDSGYVQFLSELFKQHDISPSLIEIEFTESIFIENDVEATNLFHDLKALGVRMALDDFGTGYSSLNYLTYIPVDKIKVDKSLIDIYLGKNECENTFIGNIIRLAHSLDLVITIEGVEEEWQYEQLNILGCDYIQGYYFSKPLKSSEVLSLPNPIK